MISDSSIPCKGFGKVLYKTAQHVGKARSVKRKGRRILVDVVEAKIVGRDFAFPASCDRKCFARWYRRTSYKIARIEK